MYISYRKIAQGIAVFALSAGIVGIAFSSDGDNEAKKVAVSNTKKEIQQQGSIKESLDSSRINKKSDGPAKVTSRAVQSKPTEDFKYNVKQGDTLYDLAIKHGISVEEIMLASKIEKERLAIDQELVIPVSGKYKKAVAMKRAQVAAEKKKAAAATAPKKVASRSTAARQEPVKAGVSGTRVGSMISWSQVSGLFPRGSVATVTDVDTGLTFKVKRFQGTYHADSEPLTANDTAILKRLYGGSWSWSRRAVVVSIGGKNIAASINGMPHGEDSISNNNFAGHICIHFKDSTTHGSSYTKSGKPKVDPQHQAMVRKAAGL